MQMISSFETNGLRFDMFTREERFLAPNAVLVSGRNNSMLIDCGFVKSDTDCRCCCGLRPGPALAPAEPRHRRELLGG
jgi:hypothetical protein